MPITVPVPANKILISDGTQFLDKYPPGFALATDLGGAGITNSASETSLLSAALTNMFPAGVAIGDAVHIRAAGTYKSTTSAQTPTLNLYMGSTVIATATAASTTANANFRNWMLDLEVIYTVIAGAGSGAVRVLGSIWIGTSSGTGFQSQQALGDEFFGDAAAQTIATNATATCDLKGQLSSGTATATMALNIFRARYYPKNW